jgi:hypothetical protein
VSSYKGKISEKDIFSLKESVKNDPEFGIDFNVLDDFTESNFNISDESYARALEWLKENFSSKRNSAILTETPEQVVNIVKLKSLNKAILPMDIKIFSTLTAALYWVGLNDSHREEIQAILKDLK